ncbi:hypothetical protein K456DRAFT_1153935 [Colletotrichum gloeosporioides 23]|nr:hypothetical protein K456DRAFT_1153935 [Colletotrichum gloeosporioides 23]
MGFASACQHKLHQQDKIPRCSRHSRCWDRWRLLALQGYRARCLPAHHPRYPCCCCCFVFNAVAARAQPPLRQTSRRVCGVEGRRL